MSAAPVPPSLLQPGLAALWAAARRRLDTAGPAQRGSIARPDLDLAATHAIESLLGRPSTRRVDLGHLEAALVDRGVGRDLDDALTCLGHPPSAEVARRRSDRARADAAGAAVEQAVASWPEPWAGEWAGGVRRAGVLAGLDAPAVAALVGDVRRLLDRMGQLGQLAVSRTELAAQLLGSSHALDRGTRHATALTHALRHAFTAADDRDLWERAGILADRVSAPALVWNLPATGSTGVEQLARAAAEAGLPVHLTLFALRRDTVRVASGTTVLVVENPRLVEAAAERTLPDCVVATNGNPSTAVTTLLAQLRDSGATLRYHGDFDAAGIAICRRMQAAGCNPWKMSAGDYLAALDQAAANEVRLDRDPNPCGPTPWDPDLEHEFEKRRLVVHEELVVEEILTA